MLFLECALEIEQGQWREINTAGEREKLFLLKLQPFLTLADHNCDPGRSRPGDPGGASQATCAQGLCAAWINPQPAPRP